MCVRGGGRAVLCLQEPQQQRSLGGKCAASGARGEVETELAPRTRGRCRRLVLSASRSHPCPFLRPEPGRPPNLHRGGQGQAWALVLVPFTVRGWRLGRERECECFIIEKAGSWSPTASGHPSLVPPAPLWESTSPERELGWVSLHTHCVPRPSPALGSAQPWSCAPPPPGPGGWGCSLQGGLGTGWGPGVLAVQGLVSGHRHLCRC